MVHVALFAFPSCSAVNAGHELTSNWVLRSPRVLPAMHYTGTLYADGSKFDSSVGGQPFVFTLGQGEVIKGWDMGLTNMCIGCVSLYACASGDCCCSACCFFVSMGIVCLLFVLCAVALST